MGKAKTERRLKDNEAQAVARTIRVSPQKLNLVAALIRGKKVDRALAELEFSRKRIAGTVRKTLESRSPTPKTTMISTSTSWSSPRPMSASRSP
jgi:ribosomal protein L22